MSQDFGNHFIRKPAKPGAAATTGLPSRPAIVPPKRAAAPPAPAPEVEAPAEPKRVVVKPGPIRVEIKKAAPPKAAAPAKPVAHPSPAHAHAQPKRAIKRLEHKPTYSKIFRWQLPEGELAPATVEVAGTFNHWQKVPLEHEGVTDIWQVTVANIAGHRPHHYMIFVNGHPAADKNAEGFAIPHGPQEEAAALTTPRGPRVFLLSAQAR